MSTAEKAKVRKASRAANRGPASANGKTWIDVAASGHVHVRRAGRPIKRGFLPCFSVDSAIEAKRLIVFACVLCRDGSGYAVPNFVTHDLDSISRARDRFETHLKILRSRRERSVSR